MTIARSALLPLALLGLSACAGSPPAGPIARYAAGETEPRAALASLPAAAGRVVAVRRTGSANGVSEQVVLDGPAAMTGENRITVAVSAPGIMSGARDRTLDGEPPSEESLDAEMLSALPGAQMTISSDVERNAEGPFGYATGTLGRLTCVYAWQYLAPQRPLSLIDGIMASRPSVTSVRVRLCRDLPAATLVGFVRDLSLVRREDDAAGPPSAVLRSGGDALDAALGARHEPARSGAAALAGASVEGPRLHPRLPRSVRHRHAAFRRTGRTTSRRLDPAPHRERPDLGSSGATRVPMPDQVAAAAVRPRPEPARVTVGVDPLPLPH